MRFLDIKRLFATFSLALMALLSACTKEEPTTLTVKEQQYLLFDQIDKKGAPTIIGNTFFTAENNRTKIKVFYFQETKFTEPRTPALYQNDLLSGGTKVMDLSPITSAQAGYSETILDVPYEQAISNSYHLKMTKSAKNDTIIAATDLGVIGFKGLTYNFNYPLTATRNNIERGSMIMWQRRNNEFYVNVALDTMLTGNRYFIDIYSGDTSTVNSQKFLSIGEIPNTTAGKKYKVANVKTTETGTSLTYETLKTADIHIEVRKMPGNIIVSKAVAGKYQIK